VRPDMDGLACSEDVLRVVPNANKISAGFLYGYLSSKFGVPIVTAGTYGAVIQHIEPHQIAELPVPRLGESFENRIDNLIRQAAHIRAEAAKSLEDAKGKFDWLNTQTNNKKATLKTNVVPSTAIRSRFDAAFYNPIASQIERDIRSRPHTTIGEMCRRVFLPGIFKRILTDDSKFGARYYSGSALYWLEPIPKNRLSEKTTLFKDVLLEEGTILVQAFGQEGGLIGRPAWVGRHLAHATTTHMLVRLNTHEKDMAGYLYAYISSLAGHTVISKFPYGGSIPHMDERGISSVPVPLLAKAEMLALSEQVLRALSARDDALDLELKARAMIEEAIMQR
jgi:type I restriction enzyme S subunit